LVSLKTPKVLSLNYARRDAAEPCGAAIFAKASPVRMVAHLATGRREAGVAGL